MPKAILAIRSYPATLLLALFLFLITLVVTTGSLGKVGAGGDSGDGGSGIGGTGRSGEFGGSGFGGTGGPSPFFTSLEDEGHDVPEFAVSPVELPVFELMTELTSGQTHDPAILIIETSLINVLEETVEQHPLVQESRADLAVDDPVVRAVDTTDSVQPATTPLQIVDTALLEFSTPGQIARPSVNSTPLNENSLSTVAGHTAETESAPQQHVAEAKPANLEVTAPASNEPEIDRRSLPDRIQRPDLPPFQRIRPVERASVMPPRVQPMRI
ncbi:MAG: hypothetical protein Q8L60_17300 [Gammaproteobacteria bacterium]|nr:hypothetical protein [Gammaproteobacteria bacterium]MDP2141017.1 hypothetical protein [Gammaproteobacteria bacterium]MDP2349239.1 hypothetical protein [Gammaproteobacteria bacterium]